MAFFKPIINLLNKSVGPAPPPPKTLSAPSPVQTPAPIPKPKIIYNLIPLNVSGYYTVTGPSEVTFYSTTDKPIIPIGPGWYSDSIFGIVGKVRVKSVSLESGPGYNWSFIFQTYKDQNLEGTQQVVSATLYPPESTKMKGTQVPLYGYYSITAGILTFFFTVPPPKSHLTGWVVTGLPGISDVLEVRNYGFNYATLVPVDESVLQDTKTTVKVNGFPAALQESAIAPFSPGKMKSYSLKGDDIPNVQVQLNPNIHVGNYPIQRDLNTDTSWSDVPPDGRIFPRSPMIEPGTGIKGWQPPP
jgi:hypothetical protein